VEKMRITIWLSIAVFVSTLIWPHLLHYDALLWCTLSIVVFLYWPRWRILIALPLTVLYFSGYANMTLLGFSNEIMAGHSQTNGKSILSAKAVSSDTYPLHFFANTINEHDNNITVQVKSLINTKNSGYFIAKIISINQIYCQSCPLVEMHWFKPTFQVQAGQVHEFYANVKALQGKENPGSFDRQKWRYSDHIAYIATIKKHIRMRDAQPSLRAELYEKVLNATQGFEQQGAILALLFANKTLIPAAEKQTIQALGIAHLFAISGLHIGLVFTFTFVCCFWIMKRIVPVASLGWSTWHIANVIALGACLGYGYISGFSLPTQRSLIMLMLSVLVLSQHRKVGKVDLLGLCLWLVLLVDPLAVLSSSLWLSFIAISTILTVVWAFSHAGSHDTEKMPSWQRWGRKRWEVIKWLLLVQFLLTFCMLPIQLTQFSALSGTAFVVNLIAIPLFSLLIIPITLVGGVVLFVFEPIGVLLLHTADLILSTFLLGFTYLSTQYWQFSHAQITFILSVIVFVCMGLFLWSLKKHFTFNGYYSLALMSLPLLFIGIRQWQVQWQRRHSWQVEVFDIGQGLSVLVRSNGQTLMYDTGPSYPPYYVAARSEILPYLQQQGITQLNALFVNHSNKTHSEGANTLIEALPILHLYSGEADEMNKKLTSHPQFQQRYRQCLAGQSFQLGGLSVDVLSPKQTGQRHNENACVVKISDGARSVLLTGDISKDVEHKLLYTADQKATHSMLQADIIIAPHYGSKTSSSDAFITEVAPDWVVFSVGYKNRWHVPAAEVMSRYEKHGTQQLITANTGFIRFNVQNQHIEVKTYREDLAAYWYHHHIEF